MFIKKQKVPTKITLDKLLSNPKDHNNCKVEVDDLIIDKIVTIPYQCPVYLVVHHQTNPKRGILYAYGTAALIALLSEPGQRINVAGTFYGYTDRGKYIEVRTIVNYDLSDIDI